jgi:hypothetical protein
VNERQTLLCAYPDQPTADTARGVYADRPRDHDPVLAAPSRTITEPRSHPTRAGLASYIVTATDDSADLLRSEAGDRWSGPHEEEA